MPEGVEFWHWWILAAALFTVELLVPSTFLLWPGVAAVVVGASLLVVDFAWQGQILHFAVLTAVSAVAGRIYLRRRRAEAGDQTLNRRGQQYVGREFMLEEPIVDGRGRVKIDDTIWRVAGQDLEAGRRVRVTGVKGTELEVEAA